MSSVYPHVGPTVPSAPQTVRFVVKNVQEAAAILKEKWGKQARVVDVRQLKGKGVSSLFQAPQLEITARIGELPILKPPPPIVLCDRSSPTVSLGERLLDLGFDDFLLKDLRRLRDWPSIEKQSLQEGLMHLARVFIDAYKSIDDRPLEQKIAWIGTPGVGATTALCKAMAHFVFSKQEAVQLLKLEGEVGNADDNLQIFCQILNVQLHRDPIDLGRLVDHKRLFIDIPGVPIDHSLWEKIAARLDHLGVNSRVLVLNAAYGPQILEKIYHLGLRLNATHFVLTHADEVEQVTSFWRFILHKKLSPLGFSFGQNLTADFSHDLLPWLLSKTFPPQFL